MNVFSDTNAETTPCKCCMHSGDMVKLPTDVMSDVCIPCDVRILITVKTTWIQRYTHTLDVNVHYYMSQLMKFWYFSHMPKVVL